MCLDGEQFVGEEEQQFEDAEQHPQDQFEQGKCTRPPVDVPVAARFVSRLRFRYDSGLKTYCLILKTGEIWLSQECPDQWARSPGLTPRPPGLTKLPKHLIFDLHAPE
ncbi:hypothetical protein U9M48_003310 [Paspalum notatum var. saurae]|uniref:Uncharacterized protein n=1 Tax=Paspalum notatum var. saurae TaxID=547442 RepID=A0AAQ3PQU6_PASNO